MGRRSRRNPSAHRERGKGRATPARGAQEAQRRKKPPPRVILERPRGVDELGTRTSQATGDFDQWLRQSESPHGTNASRRVVRLGGQGIDWGAEPGPSDEVGYCMQMYRRDDCMQAAIATACQVPVEQVPDLHLARRVEKGEDPDEISRVGWEQIGRWAGQRGLDMRRHDDIPVARERWIGVICCSLPAALAGSSGGRFSDHCLVMSHDRLVFDPSCGVRPPPNMKILQFDPADITYGITFDKEEA